MEHCHNLYFLPSAVWNGFYSLTSRDRSCIRHETRVLWPLKRCHASLDDIQDQKTVVVKIDAETRELRNRVKDILASHKALGYFEYVKEEVTVKPRIEVA